MLQKRCDIHDIEIFTDKISSNINRKLKICQSLFLHMERRLQTNIRTSKYFKKLQN